jgi:hypothetical protein
MACKIYNAYTYGNTVNHLLLVERRVVITQSETALER